MAGATGLEPATSAVTGQRSNQLSYAPVANGTRNVCEIHDTRQQLYQIFRKKKTRVADAKEVGVGNPSEETYHYSNLWAIVTIALHMSTLRCLRNCTKYNFFYFQ